MSRAQKATRHSMTNNFSFKCLTYTKKKIQSTPENTHYEQGKRQNDITSRRPLPRTRLIGQSRLKDPDIKGVVI
mgnify:CR=1 FL=1